MGGELRRHFKCLIWKDGTQQEWEGCCVSVSEKRPADSKQDGWSEPSPELRIGLRVIWTREMAL